MNALSISSGTKAVTADGRSCPRCRSLATASRRELFYRLMDDGDVPAIFSWYSLALPRANPPKSLLVLSLLVIMWPATVLWYLGYVSLLQGLVIGALVPLACLLFDLSRTYPQYKSWRNEWLCGECHSVFIGKQVEPSRNSLQLT